MKITAKRIKKRWIAGGIVIVAAAVGIALFVKAKGSKDTVNAGSGQQSTVQLSKQDLVESISATGTFESATNKSVTSLPGGIGRLIGFLSVKDILHRHVVAALGIKGHGKCAAVDGAIICHRAAECAAADGSAGLVLHRAVEYAVLDGTALILHRAAECAAADGAPIIHGACFGKCAIGDFAFSCIFHRAAECAVLDVTFIVHFAVECTAADGAALIPHPIVKCAADDSAIPLRHLAVKSAAADSAVVKIHCVRCRRA